MEERPENAVDVIEDLSQEVKRNMLQEKQSTLRDTPSTSNAELLAEQQKTLFDQGEEREQEEVWRRSALVTVDLIVNKMSAHLVFIHTVKLNTSSMLYLHHLTTCFIKTSRAEISPSLYLSSF